MAKQKSQKGRGVGESLWRVSGRITIRIKNPSGEGEDVELCLAKGNFRKEVAAPRRFEALQKALTEIGDALRLQRENFLTLEKDGRINLEIGKRLSLEIAAKAEKLCDICGEGVFDRPYTG